MIFHQTTNSRGSFYYDHRIFHQFSFPPHFHRGYELIHVFYGQLDTIIDGRKCQLTTGDFALCLSNEVHTFQSVDDTRVWVGVFSPEFVPDFHKAVKGKTGKDPVFRDRKSVV